MMHTHLHRMAQYNRWANRRLYDACAALPQDQYLRERGMFFGSIHGTLNHILVGDLLWLARIEGLEAAGLRLDDRPYQDMASLREAREEQDLRMIELTAGTDQAGLDRPVRYRRATRPELVETPLHLCWLHLFNHQTHHRGQVHDQLSQTEVPPPALDLIYFLREHPEA